MRKVRFKAASIFAVATIFTGGAGTSLAQDAETTPGSPDAQPEQVTQPVAPVKAPELPPAYAPMEVGSRFNSNEPRMIPDQGELSRLKFEAPQWMNQLLSFPAKPEILKYLGDAQGADREKSASAIRSIIASSMLPEDFPPHLIPMAEWAVLYEDWRNHGGTDVFICKYQKDHFAVELLESSNHVIAFVRDLEGKRVDDFAQMLKLTFQYTGILLTEHMKPVSADTMKLFRTSMSPPHIYGYYVPKIEALTGGNTSADLMTTGGQPNEQSTSAKATAVRFFCNGDFAAFMVLKPVSGAELKNPFAKRFNALNLLGQNESPFWTKPATATPGPGASSDDLKRRQIEEYLGSFFFDEDGRRLTQHIPINDLERAFIELSPDQKNEIVRRKMIDEYYAIGMRAFSAGDYTSALINWTKILKKDPENSRAAILLQLGIKERAKEAFGGDTEKAKKERAVSEASEAIARQQTLLALKKEQNDQEDVKERAITDFRTRAVDFLSEQSYPESLREWNKLLNVDPGNPTAMLFKDLCEQKIREAAQQGPAVRKKNRVP